MKIDPDTLMSPADWAGYEMLPVPELPQRSKAPDYGSRTKWKRIFTKQKTCGCLVIRFEPYAGRAREAECGHG